MNFPLSRAALAAAFVFAAPLFMTSAVAQEVAQDAAEAPATEPAPEASEAMPEEAAPAPQAEPAPAPAPESAAAAEPEEEAVTCRYIRLDASSRRKTRVCRTVEGWRELNNRR